MYAIVRMVVTLLPCYRSLAPINGPFVHLDAEGPLIVGKLFEAPKPAVLYLSLVLCLVRPWPPFQVSHIVGTRNTTCPLLLRLPSPEDERPEFL
jgi:hypothetical protein